MSKSWVLDFGQNTDLIRARARGRARARPRSDGASVAIESGLFEQ
jgi:hypothetical protein